MSYADKCRTMTVTVTGLPEHLSSFVGLCKTVQRLGELGCSRTVHLAVDGDGPARMRFDYGATDVDEVKPAPIGDDDAVICPGMW